MKIVYRAWAISQQLHSIISSPLAVKTAPTITKSAFADFVTVAANLFAKHKDSE